MEKSQKDNMIDPFSAFFHHRFVDFSDSHVIVEWNYFIYPEEHHE
ncbi:MAG: hypothetical protein AB9903_05085 [Vulcanimicrobiota bacterium]